MKKLIFLLMLAFPVLAKAYTPPPNPNTKIRWGELLKPIELHWLSATGVNEGWVPVATGTDSIEWQLIKAGYDSIRFNPTDGWVRAYIDGVATDSTNLDGRYLQIEADPFYTADSAAIKSHLANDLDTDPTNELQTLSLDGNTLAILNGNSVDMSSLAGSGTGGGGSSTRYDKVPVTSTTVNVTYDLPFDDANYAIVKCLAYYIDTIGTDSTAWISNGIFNFQYSATGFSCNVIEPKGELIYFMVDTAQYIVPTYNGWNYGVQTLAGTSPTWDADNGLTANLTASGNTTVTLENLQPGMSGDLIISNPGVSYTLNFSGYTIYWPPHVPHSLGIVDLSGDSDLVDVISFKYNGSKVVINATFGYTP